jgi:hypothetical protein
VRGRRLVYSADELSFVKALAGVPRLIIHAEFVDMFRRRDVSADNINALCKRLGMSVRSRYTDAEIAVVREHFPNRPTRAVAAMLGRTETSVSQLAARLGLKKTAAYLASEEAGRLRRGDTRGGATRFKKGQPSHNKGLRRPGWAPGRMRESQFTKGQAGWNWKPIGSTRVVDGYEYTKVSDHRKVVCTVNWKMTHVLRWEAVNGPVPEGHALKCLDGNRLNTDPSNWECVPRGLLALLNGGPHRKRLAYDAAPAELKPIVMTRAKLAHAMKRQQAARA